MIRLSNLRNLTIVASVLAASTCLMAQPASLPASAPTPATNPADGMVTRAYDIRDLLVRIPNFGPVLVITTSNPAAQPQAPEEAVQTKGEMVANIIKSVITKFDPPSWKANGGNATAVFLNGQLVVTQKENTQVAIAAFLKGMCEERSRTVTVQSRFLAQLSQEKGEQFRDWMDKQFKIKFGEKAQYVLIDDNAAEALAKHCEQYPDSRITTPPKLTLFNGQRACVTVGGEQAIVLSPEGQLLKVIAWISQGAWLDVKTTVLDNDIVTAITPRLTALIPKSNTEYTVAESNLTVRVPSKSTILIRMPVMHMKVTGLREIPAADGATKQYEATTEPVDKNAKPVEFAYVLVRLETIAPAATQPASSDAKDKHD